MAAPRAAIRAAFAPRIAAALVAAAGCGGDAPDTEPPVETDLPDAVETDAPETPDTDPGETDPGDTDAPDTAAPEDTDPPCTTGLTVTAGVTDATLGFGDAPARTDAVSRAFEVRNDCTDRVRFLGHPDDWIAGDGFALDALPPIALDPGESATLSVTWTPGERGEVAGALALPHDGPASPVAITLTATATAPLTLVAGGDGAHLLATQDYGVSTAYEAWTTTTAHTSALIRGVCAGPSGFVAVGGNAERAWWTSPDGVAWTSHVEAGSPLVGCAWGESGFIATDGAPLWSADGEAWTRGTGGVPAHLRAITAYTADDGSQRFIAAGDAGGLAITADGATWSSTTSVATEGFRAIAAGGGLIVAAGDSGRTAASADGGASWVIGSTGGDAITGVVWASDRFLAGDGTSVYASDDGVAWTRVNAARPSPAAAVGDQVFGLVGTSLWVSTDHGFSWTALVAGAGGLGFNAGIAVEVRR
jgi:hypothetical protein